MALQVCARGLVLAAAVCLCIFAGARMYVGRLEQAAATAATPSGRTEGTRSAYTVRAEFVRSLAPYVLALTALALLLARLTAALPVAAQSRRAALAPASQEGASAVEFVIVFPILLILVLTILQIALIVHAKFVVNYAAFCAARSAIVTIPARVSSNRIRENHNVIQSNNPESPKVKIIQRSAALPCVGISPRMSSRLLINTGTSPDLSVSTRLLSLSLFIPDFEIGYIAQTSFRAPYAYDRENTKVEIKPSRTQFADHEEITVKVTHRYYLTVPFADRLFGRSFPGIGFFGAARYAEVSEQYTLLNEGEPSYPEDQQERFGDSDVEVENY